MYCLPGRHLTGRGWTSRSHARRSGCRGSAWPGSAIVPLRVDGLADEVGWSRKRLWSRFRSQLGTTPKCAARLVRFDHAAHLLAAGHAAARVAAENGYVDQSHLHREVATFAGLTPTALAVAPWLAVDDVAWPASSPGRMAGFIARRRKHAFLR
jgi:AraC-like DNA-binding protein